MHPRNLLTTALLLAVTHYVAFQAGQSELYYQTAAGSLKPNSANSSRGVYGVNRVLHFSPSRIDLGTVPDGRPLTRIVEFSNPGPKEVSIQRIKVSCGCTSTRLLTDSDVPPQGKGQLEITFQPALSSPDFSVSVSVSYDDRSEIDRLLVSGSIDRSAPP